jgi:hypothetical protein
MDEESFTYLTSNTMATISSTLALAANVTSFDCTELWTLDSSGNYYCPYVYATSQLQTRCPHLLTGHHPRDKIDHVLSPKVSKPRRKPQLSTNFCLSSPQLCEYAKKSPKRFHWRAFTTEERPSTAYQGVTFPVLTEMAYYVEQTNGMDLFIVGLATEKLQCRPSTFKFLQGLGYAIYVSAFLMDNEALGTEDGTTDVELDHKEFVPKSTIVTPYISAVNLAALGGSSVDLSVIRKNISDANLRSRARANSGSGQKERGTSFCFVDTEEPVGMILSDSPPASTHRKSISFSLDVDVPPTLTPPLPPVQSNRALQEMQLLQEPDGDHAPEEADDDFDETALQSRFDAIQTRNRAPTWDPTYPFSFPVGEIQADESICDHLTNKDFTKITHLTDGSNSNIFTAFYKGQKVIIKRIKEGMETDPIALHEFDLEYGMLSRMKHKHIVRILGAGYDPRRFMVLEYLSEGTLHDLLAQHEAKRGFANLMFRKPTFTYVQLLQKARDMAEALDYLHFRCHPGATIIHRGESTVRSCCAMYLKSFFDAFRKFTVFRAFTI